MTDCPRPDAYVWLVFFDDGIELPALAGVFTTEARAEAYMREHSGWRSCERWRVDREYGGRFD